MPEPRPLALVTGASSGIGRGIAIAMARAGADVAVTYRANESGARETERAIRALGRKAAVGLAARDAFGRLDVWVNNAGADILTGSAASLPDAGKLDLLLGTPDDVAGAAVFLASPAAAYLTGQTINIGGGSVM